MKQVPLVDRIETLRVECDARIEELAKRAAKDCPGVPLAVVRRTMAAKHGSNVFDQAKGLAGEYE